MLPDLKKGMASHLQAMAPSKSIFESLGSKPQYLTKFFEHARFHSPESVPDNSPPLNIEEEESDEEQFDEQEVNREQVDSHLLVAHLEVETVSLNLKVWLRGIYRADKVQRKKLEDFEHQIYKSQEEVIKPYKAFLVSNKSKEQDAMPMLNHYRDRLEEAWQNLSAEKKRINFEMLEEDHRRLDTEEVFVCSLLGLKLDFLNRLEKMPCEIRDHRTLCAWIVIFLRNNYNSLRLTEMNSLKKDLLDAIGFDPLSSAVETILARAKNMEQHIESCDWAEIYVEDEFKHNPLLSQQRSTFPFGNKGNEWFEWSENEEHRHVNIVKLVSNETEIFSASQSMMRNFEFEDEEHTVLFHGTDHESATDILIGRGIYLWAGRQKRDFSSGEGFYLTNKLDVALNWALRKTAKPAILVFRVNHVFLNSKARKLTLNAEDGRWREIVTSFRLDKRTAKTKQSLSAFDVIEGPVATVSSSGGRASNGDELVFEPKPSSYQMCLISEDFAEKFEHTLHSILFYDIS